jgi:hypothetical protein
MFADAKSNTYHVRLVRSGQPHAAFDSMPDMTPNPFDIPDLTNQALATVVTTSAITVSGLNAIVTAATTAGTIVKNGSNTASATSDVGNGDTVAIRLTSPASLSTTTNGTLTIGTVSDPFSVTTVSVLPVNGACGTANGAATAFPPSSNLCAAGDAGTVTLAAPWSWQCVGTGGGSTANCTAPNQTTPASGGSGRAVISGDTWAVNAVSSSGFIPISGDPKSPPGLPPGINFPHGLLDFTLNGGTPGSTATITITYPGAIPAGATYWKFGPSPAGFNCTGAGCLVAHWYQMPAGQAIIAGNTVTLTIVDGGVGDDDLAANGTIVDQGGPGVPGAPVGATGIPTLSEWGAIVLSSVLALTGIMQLRRRRVDGRATRVMPLSWRKS